VTSREGAATGEARAYHHGRTPAAWAGSIIAAVAFVLGAVAFVTGPNLTLVWIAAVLLVLSIVVGGVLRRMGYGQS
jgi:hypothetical protein